MTALATPRLTDKVVYDYWQRKGADMGTDPGATIRDQHYRNLETDAILRMIESDDTVLDIGCGNGLTTMRYASQAKRVVGIDYAPNMISAAEERAASGNASLSAKVTFQVEDARRLPFEDERFSKVIMQRCLINIPNPAQQIDAAREAGRVLQAGGLFLLAEVTQDGHDRVNTFREMFGLDKLKVHWHNTYLDETSFRDAIAGVFEVIDVVRFGMYGFLSKVVHPLLVQPDEPAFDAPFNELAARIARKIPDFQACSHQVLFVLRKKEH